MAPAKQAASAAGKAEGALASVPSWAIAVVVALALAGAIALFVWWYRTKRKPATPATSAPARAPSIGKSALKDAWTAFLDKAPSAAEEYPVFIVLGDAGVGKSHLIDGRVDWKGQDAQFRPSALASDQIKLYLGPGVVVQEIAAPLLLDSREETKPALTALWGSLGDRPPTVVMVLDAAALASAPADDLKHQAELVQLAHEARGKINILSGICGKAPIRVRLCLTHLDALDGYSELAAVLRARRMDRRLPLTSDWSPSGLARCLDDLGDYVSGALTSQPVEGFEKSVRFFSRMDAVFAALSPFVLALGAQDSLSTTPAIDDLALSALSPDDHVGDPFTVDPAAVTADARLAEARTQRNGLAILGLVASLTAGFFGYHDYKLHQAQEAVSAFVRSASGAGLATTGDDLTRAERLAGERLDELSRSELLWPPLRVSFLDDKRRVRKTFADTLRTTYLLPPLDGKLDRDRLVYAVGLVYAARDNDLGALVKADAPRWVERLGLPETVPEDYVASSDRAWSDVVKATTAPAAGGVSPTDTQAWFSYLTELDGLFGSDEITPAQLKTAQQHAVPLRDVLEQSRFYPSVKEIVDILARDRRLDIEGMFGSLSEPNPTPAWVHDNQDTLTSLLALVRSSALPAVRVDGISLQQLLNVLNPAPPASASAAPSASASAAAPATTEGAAAGSVTPREYRLTLNQQSFTFRAATWSEVLLHSRTGLLVDAFIADNRAKGRYPFFASDPPPYIDVGASGNPSRGPTAVIRGVYSRAAVEGDLKPVLAGFDKQLDGAPLTSNHQKVLTSYVLEETRRYADRYRDELRGYYQSYRYNPATAAALEYDLTELASPSSWLATFLDIVADQSTIDLKGTAPYLDALGANLEMFKPVVAIAGKLDKYTSVVSKMLPPASPPSDKPPVLADLLTSEGKAALAILRGDKDNALAAVAPPLDAAGLPNDLRGPFLGPVYSAYGFGRASIEQTIAQRWKQEILAESAPVLARYPFDPRASLDASIADVEALFVPVKGRFWDGFTRLVSPVCDGAEGRWFARTAPSGLQSPQLPAGMLKLVNALGTLSGRLWDADGKPRALSIGAQAQPLPTPEPGDPAVTLSQLHTGEVSVFGFNQTPAPQPLDLVWWSQGTSSIDIQLLTPDTGKKQYQTLPAPDSAWSFYRLLDSAASISAQLEVTWNVPVDTAGHTRKIRFVLASDPWAPFRLPPTGM